jgi:hypothetical protein
MEASMFKRTALIALAGMLAVSGSALADEDKDESGKGDRRRDYNKRHDDGGRRGHDGSYFRQRGYDRIPNGHLPPPGECRIWYPDRPAGQQPPPFKCGEARRRVEPGGWMMRPGRRSEEVEVAVYDPRRPGVVIDVAIFDARSGSMIRIGAAK